MAANLFSEASARYSFSHDINLPSFVPSPSDQSEFDNGIDFEFGISGSFNQESSSADELFSQGILLPKEIREKGVLESKQHDSGLKEITEAAKPSNLVEYEQKAQSKTSFWSLVRSTSLNLNPDAKCYKKGFLCSLQGLSRSNSTGSVQNIKKSMQHKDKAVLNASKHPTLPKSSSTSSTSSSSTNSSYNQYNHKLQNPKSLYGATPYSPGRGARTTSVLNVPSPYISNTNLLGLGSLFRNGKDKKSKK